VNRYRFLRDSNIAARMGASDLPGDIDELQGTPETLQLRQQDFVQHPADVYAVLWSAAGGFGDPLEREPARVAADVDNGDVSIAAAKDIYGVVLAADGSAALEATRRERDAQRRARLERAVKPPAVTRTLAGKLHFLATENLAVRESGKALHWACAGCAADLGPLKDNYKARCARDDRPIEAANPIVGDPKRFIDPLPAFRQFSCPSCGRLIENEVARAGDPLLADIELRPK
jgi:N-methylhydantoinase B